MIVGLNFCPFAKPVVESGAVAYTVVNDRGFEACLTVLNSEMYRLEADSTIEMALLICPTGFESFDDYLDLVSVAEALLADEGFEGVFQIASFHPDYCFEGLQYDDAANYTNRSPYPMLHILREASVEKALESVSNPEKIPARNIEFARTAGVEKLRKLLDFCR